MFDVTNTPDLTQRQEKIAHSIAISSLYENYALGMDLNTQRPAANLGLVRAIEKRLQAYAALTNKTYPSGMTALSAMGELLRDAPEFFRSKNAVADFWHLHSEAIHLRSHYREADLPLGYTAQLVNLNRALKDGVERMVEGTPLEAPYILNELSMKEGAAISTEACTDNDQFPLSGVTHERERAVG